VVSVSADLREKLVAAGVEGDRIEVLRNGVDRSIFRPADRSASRRELGLPDGGRIVLFAGNLKAGKGVELLIEAAGAADVEGLSLHIVGDGPLESELRNLARGAEVFFHGRQPLERVAAWMNAADLFCLPSYDEGMPNVILEALSCAIPVVATDTGGIPEVVEPSSGMLFARGDAAGLARTLEEALSRDWDRGAIDPPAGSWDENAAKLLSILSSAIR
jgi:glycosyltransferase involved in cell wall biosynthesis